MEVIVATTPEAAQQKQHSLSRKIVSFQQVRDMATEELEQMSAAHDAEIAILNGKLDAHDDEAWAKKARHALRLLCLHRSWINKEIKSRRKSLQISKMREFAEIAAVSRKEAQREHNERMRVAHELKMQRIQENKEANLRDIAIFKEVARETLGDEMYSYLWELTRVRIEQATT